MREKTLLVIVLLCFSVHAAAAANGFYVGASGQLYSVDVQSFDDQEVGFKLFGGYRFHSTDNFLDYIAVEASWQKPREFGDEVDIGGESIDVGLDVDGYSFEVLGIFPTAHEVEIFGKLGYYDFDVDVDADAIGISVAGSDDGLTAGIGMMAEAFPNITMRLEFNWFDVDDSVWTVGFGAQWHFGGSK